MDDLFETKRSDKHLTKQCVILWPYENQKKNCYFIKRQDRDNNMGISSNANNEKNTRIPQPQTNCVCNTWQYYCSEFYLTENKNHNCFSWLVWSRI